MNETEIHHLAQIIAGEVMGCPVIAYYALAWVYTRNTTFYGRGSPNNAAMFVSYNWYKIPDPTFGATFLFSGRDLQKEKVRDLLWRSRGPPIVPTAVFHCNYDSVYAFAYEEDATGFLDKVQRTRINYMIYYLHEFGVVKVPTYKQVMKRLK